MSEQMRCLNCGHTWKTRGNNFAATQCPQCRRHRLVDNQVFERAAIELVRLLRNPGETDPLEEFSRALDHAHEIVEKTFPSPVLAGQAAFEVTREALERLGFPRPPRVQPSP